MKDVVGYEGLYAVTSCGRVWSYKNKMFLKPQDNRKGYMYVNLIKDKKRHKVYVHRIVAEAYIPNPENLETIDHIDNNKQNNCINNLRWMNLLDNIDRSIHARIKIRCVETGEEYESLRDCRRKTGFSHGNLSHHLRGISHENVNGYHFTKVN